MQGCGIGVPEERGDGVPDAEGAGGEGAEEVELRSYDVGVREVCGVGGGEEGAGAICEAATGEDGVSM